MKPNEIEGETKATTDTSIQRKHFSLEIKGDMEYRKHLHKYKITEEAFHPLENKEPLPICIEPPRGKQNLVQPKFQSNDESPNEHKYALHTQYSTHHEFPLGRKPSYLNACRAAIRRNSKRGSDRDNAMNDRSQAYIVEIEKIKNNCFEKVQITSDF